jgi:hypothetical protein
MANQALIQGEGQLRQSQGFFDIAKAVESGITTGMNPGTVKKNNQIQRQVNSYMSNLKTDMDFTGFSSQETASMRDFLLQERNKYAQAAKEAAKFEDTTDPRYMEYVDIMQGVNNSFTNLAAQLKSYKQSKAQYAKDQLDGTISLGNDPVMNSDAAKMYGFIDADGDGRNDGGVNAPFIIQEGGNLGFNINDQILSYDDAPQPFLKDYKLASSIISKNETIYNNAARGGQWNPYTQNAYRLELENAFQNDDTLKSILADFEGELPTGDIQDKLDNGFYPNGFDDVLGDNGEVISAGARTDLINRMVQAREDVWKNGNAAYKKKYPKGTDGDGDDSFQLSGTQIARNQDETVSLQAYVDDENLFGAREFNYIVRQPVSRRSTTAKAYRIQKTKDGKYYLFTNGMPEALTPELAKQMFNIVLPQ